MYEPRAVGVFAGHFGHVVVCSGRQRTGTECKSVVRVVHSLEEPFNVLVARYDARQAEYGEWWIVRVYAHVHAVLVAGWHYGRKEVAHVLPQLLFRDAFVKVEQLAEQFNGVFVVLRNVAVDEALCLHDNVLYKLVVVCRGHSLLQFLHLGHHLGAVVFFCAFAFQ